MNHHSFFRHSLFFICALAAVAACSESKPPAPAAPKPPVVTATSEHVFFIDGPAGKLRVSDGGSGGNPVLFLHGLGGDIESWRAQLDHLRGFRRAIAFEARGHGQSARAPEASYTMQGLADDIDAVAKALKLGKFVLVGHSIAGPPLQLYAAQHADTLAGLVFVDAIGDFKHAGTPVEMEAFLQGDIAMKADPAKQAAEFTQTLGAGARPETKARVLKSLAEMDPKAWAPLRADMVHFRAPQDLSKTSIPLFSIENDANLLPIRFSVLVPTSPVLTLVHVSHWLMMDDPDGFNRALDGFLAAH